MKMNKQKQGTVLSVKSIAEKVYRVQLKINEIPNKLIAGQFINVKVPGGKCILRRPFGICDYNIKDSIIDFCFQVKGEGTAILSQMKIGEELDVLMPLGNGFPESSGQKLMVIGGGIGLFPLLPLGKESKNIHTFLGFKNKSAALLLSDFEAISKELVIASDDGSIGEKGFITDIAKREIERVKPDIIYACGPTPMFKSMQEIFKDVIIPIYVSLEERMACGFGACLCCNTRVNKEGATEALRVCCEGPIFKLNEIEI